MKALFHALKAHLFVPVTICGSATYLTVGFTQFPLTTKRHNSIHQLWTAGWHSSLRAGWPCWMLVEFKGWHRDNCVWVGIGYSDTWWRRQMEAFSALLARYAGNSPVTGEFPTQRPVTWSFDVFFNLRPNKRLSKQSWDWWFEMPSRSLLRHCNATHLVSTAENPAWTPGRYYSNDEFNETEDDEMRIHGYSCFVMGVVVIGILKVNHLC